MKPNLKWAAVVVGCTGIAAAAFVGGRAWAGGIPTAGALNYSGLLQDASGAPLSGTHYVAVKFWNDAVATAPGNVLCDTMTPTAISLSNGRFTITLPDKCTSQIGINTAIWAEVLVGTTADAVGSLGRAKIGAVPFAVEANHAVGADTSKKADSAATAAMLTGSVRSGLFAISTNCVDGPSFVLDCACPAGSYAISGGGFSNAGYIYETANKFTSATTRDLTTWRLGCKNIAGAVIKCDNAYALCLAISP